MLFTFINHAILRFMSRNGKQIMTEKEFTDIATELRELALKKGRSYPLDNDEADDIAQDTMLRLWSLRQKVKTKAHARGLAVSIAAHGAIDRMRKRRTATLRPTGKEPIAPANPDTILQEKADDEWLTRELKKLPSTEYQVLHLRQAEQKTAEEIGAILGITPQSVATLLSRARRKLMEEIKKRRR